MPESGAALVTGAGRRIGRALALALGEAGWAVAVHYRGSADAAEAVASTIRDGGGQAATVQADLASEAATSGLVDAATNALARPLTLLVNSASLFEADSAQAHEREGWDRHMNVNLRAPVLLAKQFAAQLPSEARGLVINLIDQRVWKLTPQFFTYTLSKSALWTATRTLAQALAPAIRVNAIGPGPTLQSIHQSAEDFAAERAATLTGEGSNPDEIVRAMRYLIEARAVTGQMIACDGGQHLLWQTPDTQI